MHNNVLSSRVLQNFAAVNAVDQMSTARTLSIIIISAAVFIGIVHCISVSTSMKKTYAVCMDYIYIYIYIYIINI